MWALGDYPTVASEVISELGPVLVTATGVRRGDRVLDVAAGSGNAAVPAALDRRRGRGLGPDSRAVHGRPGVRGGRTAST